MLGKEQVFSRLCLGKPNSFTLLKTSVKVVKIKKNIFLFQLVTRIWMLFDEYNKVDTSYKSWRCSARECMKKVIEFMAKWDGKIVKEVCP